MDSPLRSLHGSRWILAGLVTAGLAVPALAGNVLTVGGVGGNFADIQSAVTAAANDDVILVRAGTYAGFAIDGKSLGVVADTGAVVNVNSQVVVQNVAAGGRVVMAGLHVVDTGVFLDSFLLVSNVAGSVRMVGCEIGRASWTAEVWETQAAATIVNSPDVALTGCTLRGRNGPREQLLDIAPPAGGSGIDVQSSRVSLHDCQCTGGQGGPPYGDRQGCPGGDGCRVLGSASLLHASGSTFQGGNAADGHDQMDCLDFLAGDGGPGGNGIATMAPGSPAPQVILLDTTLVVGAGGQGGTGACGPDGLDGPPGMQMELAPGTQLTQIPGSNRRMIMPVPVRESAPVSLTFTGVPGDSVRLTMWDQAGFVFVPTYNGVLLERAPLLRRINLGIVADTGALTATIAFPALPPGVQARLYFLQPYFIDTSNTVRLGSAVGQVVLDSAF